LLGTVAGAMTSGRLIPHLRHYKRIALGGGLFSAASLLALGFVASDSALPTVEALTVCIGLGTGAAFPVATVSVPNAVDRMHLGGATVVLTFLRSLGGALGVALLGAVALGYGLPLGREGTDFTAHAASGQAFSTIFFVCAAISLASSAAFLLMPEKP